MSNRWQSQLTAITPEIMAGLSPKGLGSFEVNSYSDLLQKGRIDSFCKMINKNDGIKRKDWSSPN
jgi:hypothetical protein